ncbi:MAG TPA: glycoside hydrolase family 16 protein [Thermoleophilia bacterium]|nr:glycoside hydrolase family 16 protein [Thermoleophilia bacterium]
MKILTLAAVAVAALAVAAPARAQTLAWSDSFSGTKVNSHIWWVHKSGAGNDHLATCRAANVKLNGKGQLVITARKSAGKYTSGEMESNLTATCGTLKARIRLPAGKGLWPAFWALGADYDSAVWPACGELDAMENLGNNTHVVYGSVHAPSYDRTTARRSAANLAAGYHTYGVTWTPTMVRMSLDGKAYVTYMPNMSSIFSKRFIVILNLAVGGSWPGNPNAKTRFPASMLVDWVRAYKS